MYAASALRSKSLGISTRPYPMRNIPVVIPNMFEIAIPAWARAAYNPIQFVLAENKVLVHMLTGPPKCSAREFEIRNLS